MKRKRLVLMLTVIFLSGTLFVYGSWYRGQFLSKGEMYAYINYGTSKELSPVVILQDMKYRKAYTDYYDKLFQRELNVTISDMPIKRLSISEPVYIVGYSADSQLAKVVSLTPAAIGLGTHMLSAGLMRNFCIQNLENE